MKLAFVTWNAPGNEGTGAVHSSTQIVSELSGEHEITVFCGVPPDDRARSQLDVEFELVDTIAGPFPHQRKFSAGLKNIYTQFDQFDLVHSYQMDVLPAIEYISARTSIQSVVALNAYGGICPKNDLLYMNESECSGGGYMKCLNCGIQTMQWGSNRREILKRKAKRGAAHLMNLNMIRQGMENAELIGNFHTFNDMVKNKYVEHGYPSDRITIINNILDTRFIVANEADSEEPYKLIYAGRLSEEKGVDRLIPILAWLRNHSEYEFELTVAGYGLLLPMLKTQAREAGVTDSVTFLGHVKYKEMPDIYASHHLLVYPGVWDEPFGRVFIEAMATGTPIVATDVGAITEIVGAAGVTTEPEISEIGREIVQIVSTDRLSEMSENCTSEIERFLPRNVFPDIRQMYDDVLTSVG